MEWMYLYFSSWAHSFHETVWRWHAFFIAFLAVNNSEISDLHHVPKATIMNFNGKSSNNNANSSCLLRTYQVPSSMLSVHVVSLILTTILWDGQSYFSAFCSWGNLSEVTQLGSCATKFWAWQWASGASPKHYPSVLRSTCWQWRYKFFIDLDVRKEKHAAGAKLNETIFPSQLFFKLWVLGNEEKLRFCIVL